MGSITNGEHSTYRESTKNKDILAFLDHLVPDKFSAPRCKLLNYVLKNKSIKIKYGCIEFWTTIFLSSVWLNLLEVEAGSLS